MQAPWCFTLDPQIRVDLCDIQPCRKYDIISGLERCYI